MRWTIEDGFRFKDDLADLIANNRDADDLPLILTKHIEDTLTIYGVGYNPDTVPLIMCKTIRRVDSNRSRRLMASLGFTREWLFTLLLGLWVGNRINEAEMDGRYSA